jgi:eukaryotic-like serine/threonine-protein kinase
MSAKIIIDVSNTKGRKRVFSYEDHDTFMVGRMDDCHLCIEDDSYLSRHHFILEVNPPNARLQDLGSLNGTYVNKTKVGGRSVTETPEEAMSRYKFPWVDLKNGDVIITGDTRFNVMIQSSNVITGPVRCQKCGRDVSNEVGAMRGGTYICESCQKSAEARPFELLQQFLEESRFGRSVHRKNATSTLKYGFYQETPVNFADWDVVKVLGVGGFGASYLLQNRSTKKPAVLKLMLPKIAASEAVKVRFLEETASIRKISHPNLVELYESGYRNGIFYFLMEYCNIGNLESLRQGGVVKPGDLMLAMLQALEPLTLAHSNGFIHRNLKPQNILLNTADKKLFVKITDFGLTRSFILNGLSGMTVTGDSTGAYPYMPREQVVDFKYSRPETDIWALGATMYNLLTGEFPRNFLHSRDPLDVILNGDIIPIQSRDASIPKELAEIVDRSVRNDPAGRYQHAGEMLSALQRVYKITPV